MHIQIVNFNLKDLSHQGYLDLCAQIAPAFAAVPGLIGKTWLADEATNTYGGVYHWESRAAMERFAQSDLFRTVVTHPNLANLTARDFDVLDAPSRVTLSLGALAA